MRLQGLSTAGVKRRDGGAVDTLRTDSRDPRIHEEAALLGRLFVRASFLLDWRSVKKTCRGQVFSAAPAELISAGGNHAGAENGGVQFPGNLPVPIRPAAPTKKGRPLRDGPARMGRSPSQFRDTAVPLTVTISIPLSAPSTS